MAVDVVGNVSGTPAASLEESGEAAAARTFTTLMIGALLFIAALLFILL